MAETNTVLGNSKTTLAGTFHALDYSKYAQGYLSAAAYRFNSRFDLRGSSPKSSSTLRGEPRSGEKDQTRVC